MQCKSKYFYTSLPWHLQFNEFLEFGKLANGNPFSMSMRVHLFWSQFLDSSFIEFPEKTDNIHENGIEDIALDRNQCQ